MSVIVSVRAVDIPERTGPVEYRRIWRSQMEEYLSDGWCVYHSPRGLRILTHLRYFFWLGPIAVGQAS